MNKVRRHLQRQLIINPEKGREKRWVRVVKDLEVAAASGTRQILFMLTRDTGG